MSLPPPEGAQQLPPTIPPKRRRPWWQIPLVVLVVIGVAAYVVGSSSDDNGGEGDCRNVVYELSGTASRVDITMNNKDENSEQLSDVRLPWSKRIGCREDGFFAYVSAQNQGESGSVSCSITADGEEIETATSSGAFVIAKCSGSL